MLDLVEKRRLITRVRELSSDSLDSAIQRGIILKQLKLKKSEYVSERVGITYRTGNKFIQLVDDPKMYRKDWEKPGKWTTCHRLLQVADGCFDEMLAAGLVNYHTTFRRVVNYARDWRKRHCQRIRVTKKEKTILDNFPYLNKVVCGDCLDLIPQLPNDSLGGVITSPPYANQRFGKYEGVPESEYVQWLCKRMTALWPKLKMDASVFFVIRAHVSSGQVSNYVMRSVLALRERGWIQCGEQIWYKPDAPPLGSIHRPRSAFEHILWFSKTRHPYVDLKACGAPSTRIGFQSNDPHGNIRGTSPLVEGIARITDVISVPVSANEKGVSHPAMHPRKLVGKLILTYTRKGDVILDPFVGSGTTILEACHWGRNFVGMDLEPRYVDLAARRLMKEFR